MCERKLDHDGTGYIVVTGIMWRATSIPFPQRILKKVRLIVRLSQIKPPNIQVQNKIIKTSHNQIDESIFMHLHHSTTLNQKHY